MYPVETAKKPIEKAVRDLEDMDFSDGEEPEETRNWIKEMMKSRKSDYSFQRITKRRKLY